MPPYEATEVCYYPECHTETKRTDTGKHQKVLRKTVSKLLYNLLTENIRYNQLPLSTSSM